ncbi:MAG: DedA family protein [Phycisphaerae bacterium]|jgi:membrane protein DedA with SNARE-associated domain
MRLLLATGLLLALSGTSAIEAGMQQAFYPVLLGILVVASLGLPIPEDIPLIAAGVLLYKYPGIASWTGTFGVALLGIMTGDLVLYTMGRWWGLGVVDHRFVRWLITPRRLEQARRHFHRYGMWFCFFGRFFMGIRAVMCLTAGAMRFPYPRFFMADCAGALLSIPFFVYLGYWFADKIPLLRRYLSDAQGLMLILVAVAVAAIMLWYRFRRGRRRRQVTARRAARLEAQASGTAPLNGQQSPAARAEQEETDQHVIDSTP